MDLYKLKRNEVTKLLRNSKKAYFRNLRPNSKQFWKAMRLLKGDNKTVPTLVVDDHEVTSDSEKVEVLSDHFSKTCNNSLPPLPTVDIESIEVDPDSCPEQLLCTEEEVWFLLTSLDATKANNGPEGISAHMLKATAAAITPVVTKLFNLSISTGSVPQAAKSSVVVPVPKSTDHTIPSNYRSISLLAILSKVLQKYISSLVMEELHLSSHSAFHQWGFQSGHSTSSALTTVIDDWLKNMELNWQISLFCLL